MRQKRITALLLSLCLLFAMMPTAAFAAEEMISIPSGSDWKGSVFGDLGGTPTATNFGVTEKADGSVTLMAKGSKGKIKTSAANIEGMAYYYQEISPQDNFELKAKATVDVWTSASDTQQSFGIMLRNDETDMLETNKYVKDYTGAYLAAGAVDKLLQVFYKNSPTDAVAKNTFSDATAPGGGQSYDIAIQKSGSVYKLTVNGETQVLPQQITGSFNYVGLYVARNTTVTYTDVSFHKDNREPSSISVDASAFKKSYFVGDSLDLSGLKVTAAFPDLHEELLAAGDYIVGGFSGKTEGDYALTIYYNGQSAVVPGTVHVVPRVVTAMDVQYMPAKTDYYPGDYLDTQGLVVQAQYNGGGDWITLGSDEYTLSVPPTDASYSVTTATYALTKPGITTVTVRSTVTTDTYTSFDVNVNNADLIGLEVTSPTRTTYYVGDKADQFEQAGMAVAAKYSNGATVPLLRSEYTVGITDADFAVPGNQQIFVTTYKKELSPAPYFTIEVKTPVATGIVVTKYPTTTFEVNAPLDLSGLEVSTVYDNNRLVKLEPTDYDVDQGAFDNTQTGTYNIVITPHNPALAAIQLPVTVMEAYQPEWKSIRFGQSSSDTNNKIEVLDNGTVRLTALEGGGKVTGDHDGISFYYVELDPTKENFELSANVKVTAFAKEPYDGQESFGIMARDAIGTAGDSSVFGSNIAAIGGYSGGTTKPIGTQLFIRTGVTAPNSGSAGVQNTMLSAVRPVASNTFPQADYKLTLAKTNSGFSGRLNDGNTASYFAPDLMTVQDSKMYVGFYTARLATIEVSDISLKVSAAVTDAPKVEPPAQPVTPSFDFTSLARTSSSAYNLGLKASVAGTVTIKQGMNVLAADQPMAANTQLTIPTTVSASTYTNFNAVFVPSDAQYLTSYDKIVRNFTVNMHAYEGSELYVSPDGTSTGDGTEQNPLDLDTAIDYVKAGQTILVQDGTYKRSAKLEMKKGNDGTAGAYKSLIAAPGAKPVIDFDKKTEGVVLSGSYWHVKGIDFTRSAGNTKGFTVGGSYNIVEGSRFYANGDTGLQISRTDESAQREEWPHDNLILNCESFDNADPSNNNADGFAAKLTAGAGNIFRGDISHNNIDDGWDLYTKGGTGAIGAVLIEDSIAYNNGTLTNGLVGAGDKNGFKLGGEGIHVPHIIRNSIAFGNGAYGFASNSNPGVQALGRNIAFNNAKGNINFTSYTGVTLDFKLDGFISYQKGVTAKDAYPVSLNSAANFMWDGTKSVNKLGQQLSDANFASLTPVLPYERDASGAIVRGDFLKFVAPVMDSDSGSGGGGGGTPDPVTAVDGGVRITGTPKVEKVDGQDVASLTIDKSALDKALQLLAKQPAGANTVNVEVTGNATSAQVVVPGSVLAGAANGTQLAVTAQGVSYVLPLEAVDVAQAAKELGVDASSANVRITLTQVSGERKEKIAALSQTNGGTLLGEPYEFSVTVEAGGKQVQVNDFGTLYVTRSLTLEGTVDSGSATAVWIDETTGAMNFVPATFAVIDDKTVVTMKRPGNSVYAVVQNARSFDDVAGHWSQKDVERLAAKLVVQGVSARSFAPDAAVTRAEFAALLVRALGLNAAAGEAAFQDVAASDWYAGVVATAAKIGLVQGFEDGRFQPDARITREQMAVMVARAVALTGATVKTQAAPQFADRAAISLWSRDAVDQIVGAGIAQGVSGDKFAPGAEATRAEAAVMLGRMLQAVQFMN
ncbi:S-layer homology domain-containing protein [Paenibacillus oryzisoli]|uniref:S-layer homology domain-containing protein n=1 Tax=Paenibacillus oryzisoli TaxID=1850517 RepID=UPI003D27F844